MITGDEIILSAIEEHHLKQIVSWRNNPKLRQYFRQINEISLNIQTKWFYKIEQSCNDYFFSILKKEDLKIIGVCGLNYIHWVNRNAQLSIYIGENNEYIDEAGLALEAADLIINFGFNNLNLKKIICEIFSFDVKKQHLVAKLNFKLEGKLIEQVYKNGEYHDSLIFGLLRRNYV